MDCRTMYSLTESHDHCTSVQFQTELPATEKKKHDKLNDNVIHEILDTCICHIRNADVTERDV